MKEYEENEWVNDCNDWMNKWKSDCKEYEEKEWKSEWMTVMNEWVKEWMSEWMNEWMKEYEEYDWMNEWPTPKCTWRLSERDWMVPTFFTNWFISLMLKLLSFGRELYNAIFQPITPKSYLEFHWTFPLDNEEGHWYCNWQSPQRANHCYSREWWSSYYPSYPRHFLGLSKLHTQIARTRIDDKTNWITSWINPS